MNSDLLCLSRFCVGYHGETIVQPLDVTLRSGEMVGLLGRNGSGKTTLLRGICGMAESTGDCTCRGESLQKLSEKQLARRIAYIAQRSGISVPMTALEIVLMGFNPVLRTLEQPSAAQIAKARAQLSAVGLPNAAECSFFTLSEGQRQLVLLARALVQDAPLLLFDEPDSALDYNNRHRMLKTIRSRVLAEGKTALLCLHDANAAFRFCDRLLLLKEGKLIADLDLRHCTDAALEVHLRAIYGAVALVRCKNQRIMIWEDDDETTDEALSL